MRPLKHDGGDCGWAHRLHDAGEQTGGGAGAIGLHRTGGVPKVQVQRFAGRDAKVLGPESAEARQTLLQTDSQIRQIGNWSKTVQPTQNQVAIRNLAYGSDPQF